MQVLEKEHDVSMIPGFQAFVLVVKIVWENPKLSTYSNLLRLTKLGFYLQHSGDVQIRIFSHKNKVK